MIGFTDPRKACFNPLLSIHKDSLAGKSPSLPRVAAFLVDRLFAEDQSELLGHSVAGYEQFLTDPLHDSLGLSNKLRQSTNQSGRSDYDPAASNTRSLNRGKAAVAAANSRARTQFTPVVKNPAMSKIHLPLVISNKSVISFQTWMERGGRDQHIGMDEILDSDVLHLLQHKHVRDFIEEIRVVNTIAFIEAETARKMRVAEAVAIMEAVSDNVRKAVEAVTLAEDDISKGLSSITLQIQDIQRKNIQASFNASTNDKETESYPKPTYPTRAAQLPAQPDQSAPSLLNSKERFTFPFLKQSEIPNATSQSSNGPVSQSATKLPALTPATTTTQTRRTSVPESVAKSKQEDRSSAIRNMAVETVRSAFMQVSKQRGSVLQGMSPMPPGAGEVNSKYTNPGSPPQKKKGIFPINPKTGSIFSPSSVDPSVPMGIVNYDNVKTNMENLAKPGKLEPLPMLEENQNAGPFAKQAMINPATMPFTGSFLFSNDPVKASEAFLRKVTNEPIEVTDMASYALARSKNPNFTLDPNDPKNNPIDLSLRERNRAVQEANTHFSGPFPLHYNDPKQFLSTGAQVGFHANQHAAPHIHANQYAPGRTQFDVNASRLAMLRDAPMHSYSAYPPDNHYNAYGNHGTYAQYPQGYHPGYHPDGSQFGAGYGSDQDGNMDPTYLRMYDQEYLEQQMRDMYAERIAISRQRSRNRSRLANTAPSATGTQGGLPSSRSKSTPLAGKQTAKQTASAAPGTAGTNGRSKSRAESRRQMRRELDRAAKPKKKQPHLLPHRNPNPLAADPLVMSSVYTTGGPPRKPLLELQIKLLEAKLHSKEDDYKKVMALTSEFNQRRADEASLRAVYDDPLLSEEQFHSLKYLLKAKNTEHKIHRQRSISTDPTSSGLLGESKSTFEVPTTPPGTILSRRKTLPPISDPMATARTTVSSSQSPSRSVSPRLDGTASLPRSQGSPIANGTSLYSSHSPSKAAPASSTSRLNFNSILPQHLLEQQQSPKHRKSSTRASISIPISSQRYDHTGLPLESLQVSPLYSASPRYTAGTTTTAAYPQESPVPPLAYTPTGSQPQLSLRSIYTQVSSSSGSPAFAALSTPVPSRYSTVHPDSDRSSVLPAPEGQSTGASPTAFAQASGPNPSASKAAGTATSLAINHPPSNGEDASFPAASSEPDQGVFQYGSVAYEELGMVATNDEQRRLQDEIAGSDIDDLASVASDGLGGHPQGPRSDGLVYPTSDSPMVQGDTMGHGSYLIAGSPVPGDYTEEGVEFEEHSLDDGSPVLLSSTVQTPAAQYGQSTRDSANLSHSFSGPDISFVDDVYYSEIPDMDGDTRPASVAGHALDAREWLEVTESALMDETKPQSSPSYVADLTDEHEPLPEGPTTPMEQGSLHSEGYSTHSINVPGTPSRPQTAQLQVLENKGIPFSTSRKSLSKQSIAAIHPENQSRRSSIGYDMKLVP